MASNKQCCCFCMDLNQGSYLSAGFSIGLGLLGAIVAGYYASLFESGSAVAIIFWVTMAIYLGWIVFAIIMIVGLSQKSRGMLLPWVIYTSILTALLILSVIQSLAAAGATFASAAGIVGFLLNVTIIILSIYGLWCVVSHYKNNLEVE